MEPAKIWIRQIQILYFKSIRFRFRFATQYQLVQLAKLKTQNFV